MDFEWLKLQSVPTGNDKVSGWADDEPELAEDDQESSIVLSEGGEWGVDPEMRVLGEFE